MRRPRGGRMECVSLGRGGPDVSAVGLGMWQAGGKAWGSDVRDADCREAMERAVELGINLVDTAEAYGDGHSERVMSRAIRNVGRDRVFVATKVGGWHLRADDVKKACAASLKRLGVREIDLYQVHWPDPWSQVPLRETMKALEALHRAGRIRNIGVSNFAGRGAVDPRAPKNRPRTWQDARTNRAGMAAPQPKRHPDPGRQAAVAGRGERRGRRLVPQRPRSPHARRHPPADPARYVLRLTASCGASRSRPPPRRLRRR